jgi:hypothetical protein
MKNIAPNSENISIRTSTTPADSGPSGTAATAAAVLSPATRADEQHPGHCRTPEERQRPAASPAEVRALISAHTSASRAPDSGAMPGMSKDRAAGEGSVSRSTSRPAARAIRPTGTLM